MSRLVCRGVALGTLGAVLAAGPCRAENRTLADLEARLRQAAATRTRVADQRRETVAEASRLSEEITRLKDHAGNAPRADRDLETRLRQFDRLAATLDQLQAQIDRQDRESLHLKAAFDLAAAEAVRRLTRPDAGTPLDLAAGQREIEEARQRVGRLGISTTGFRPILVISLDPNEGPSEILQKMSMLNLERVRVAREITRLDQEIEVVIVRIALKKQLRDQLEEATRAASSDENLLQRESDRAGSDMAALERQRRQLIAQRLMLARADVELAATTERLQKRLDELKPHRPGGET